MKKQSNTTKKKSKTLTSKTGQNFQNLCIECHKPFQGYTRAQKVCSEKCLNERAKKFATEYEITREHRRLIKEQIEVAELEQYLEKIKVETAVIRHNEEQRLKLLESLLVEIQDCVHKPEVVAHMMNVIPEYE